MLVVSDLDALVFQHVLQRVWDLVVHHQSVAAWDVLAWQGGERGVVRLHMKACAASPASLLCRAPSSHRVALTQVEPFRRPAGAGIHDRHHPAQDRQRKDQEV